VIKGIVIDWLINWAIAWVTRWLDQNQPTSRIQKNERPQPIVKPKPGDPRKYAPVDTRPGHWNRETGSWNP
jgi:hypothetical protein